MHAQTDLIHKPDPQTSLAEAMHCDPNPELDLLTLKANYDSVFDRLKICYEKRDHIQTEIETLEPLLETARAAYFPVISAEVERIEGAAGRKKRSDAGKPRKTAEQ